MYNGLSDEEITARIMDITDIIAGLQKQVDNLILELHIRNMEKNDV